MAAVQSLLYRNRGTDCNEVSRGVLAGSTCAIAHLSYSDRHSTAQRDFLRNCSAFASVSQAASAIILRTVPRLARPRTGELWRLRY